VFAGEGGSGRAERGGQLRITENPLARRRDVLGRTRCRKEKRLAPILHQRGEVGGREEDGPAGREKLGEFRGQPLVVERSGPARLYQNVGQREQAGEFRFLHEAEIKHMALQVIRETGEEAGGVEAGAHETHARSALVQEGDRNVQVAHLRLVREGVGAGENDHLLVVRQAQLLPKRGGFGSGDPVRTVQLGVDSGEKQVRRRAGRGGSGERLDDVRDAVRQTEKRLATHGVRQARVE
jgi:hypothetical protein